MKVAAASADSVEQTTELKNALRVGFPMYAELDPYAVSEATGAYMNEGDRIHLHATGFLLDPGGTVVNALYSSGPIGRFTASDIVRKTIFEKDKA